MYLQATYETARERQADFVREAARRRAIREVEQAQVRAEPPADGATPLLLAVKRGLAAVGARIAAL
jgi:hypothetical protein